MSRSAVAACALALVMIAAAPARAERDESAEPDASASDANGGNADEARRLFELGVEHASQGDWKSADAAFRGSLELVSRPSTLLNLALASYHLGRLQECEHFAERYLKDVDPAAPAQERLEVERLRDRARAMMAVLVLTVTPPIARVWVGEAERPGGRRREVLLDPGSYRIRAEAPDHEPVQIDVELGDAEHRQARIELQPVAPRPAEVAARAVVTPEPPAAVPSATQVDEPSLLEDWRLWAVVGAAVLAGTAAAVLLSDGEPAPRYDATIVTLELAP